MKNLHLIILISLALSTIGNGQKILLNDSWRFFKGGSFGAEKPVFDDSQWRILDLPHDWSIEDLAGTESPFRADAISSVGGGFTTGGTGWYRKVITTDAADDSKLLSLYFEGVYMNSEVWLNGESIGGRPYGYSSFSIDVTGKLKSGQKNIIAVKVRNEGENSRWYSGSGIYRNVWLIKEQKIHTLDEKTTIVTPAVSNKSADVVLTIAVENKSSAKAAVRCVATILDKKNAVAGRVESSHDFPSLLSYNFDHHISVANPDLWTPDSPALYTLVTELYSGNELIEKKETKFGIRSIKIDAENGFILNGKPLKLQGGCVHNDNGPIGSRTYDRAEERKIELLKASGFNAIRCSHNPPSPAFLNACDRVGMMVIDEAFDTWSEGKNPYDYSLYFNSWWLQDLNAMLVRDRHHPCIIMWSIGNEIPNMESKNTIENAGKLADFVRSVDATRPVTAAVNGLNDRKDPFFAKLDVAGYNYADDQNSGARVYENDHRRLPKRIMFGSESYALTAFQNWMDVTDYPFVIGDFVWTAFDYIGEASIGWLGYDQKQSFYPWNLAYCGDLDICGWKRPQSYYRDALWKKDQLSIFVKPPTPSFEPNADRQAWSIWNWDDVVADWNWKGAEGKSLDVSVYSSCDQVELFLNGKSLGKKATDRNAKFMATFTVPYTAGVLQAVGTSNKKKVATAELRTAGEPAQIKLSADRDALLANNQDLSYITVEVTDAKGVKNPKAENEISFSVSGASIVAVANANPRSLESYQLSKRKAWQGRCMVIIKTNKAAGPIVVTASSAGLPTSSVTLNAK